MGSFRSVFLGLVIAGIALIVWTARVLLGGLSLTTQVFPLLPITSYLDGETLERLERCLPADTDQTTDGSWLLQARQCLRRHMEQKNSELPLTNESAVWNQTKALYPLSVERETARRRAESTSREVFYFVNAQLESLRTTNFSTQESRERFVTNTKNAIKDYARALTNDLHALRHVDNDEDWRVSESKNLGQLVQERLHSLQNPEDCSKVKLVVCDLKRDVGFGSTLHEATMCLLTAYVTQRTLVLTSQSWRFAQTTWETFLMPASGTCTAADVKDSGWSGNWVTEENPHRQTSADRIVELKTLIGNWNVSPAKFIPRAIPADLAPKLKVFHGDPAAWWVGQLVSYLLRPQPLLEQAIQGEAERMKFANPIVGVHVRRTDKVNDEGDYHSLEEYMQHVEEYYETREQRERIKERRVFLASDDPSVFAEAQRKYPKYVLTRVEGITNATAGEGRYSRDGLRAILLDLYFLSSCDFVVCTYSSNICRAVYELMQARHGDASMNVCSLDTGGHFVTIVDVHYQRAIMSHEPKSDAEIAFQVGDLIKVESYLRQDPSRRLVGNLRNGYSAGINTRSGRKGHFPSYKVVENIVEENMG